MVDIFKRFKRNSSGSQNDEGKKGFFKNAYEILIKKRPRRTRDEGPPPVDVISKGRIHTIQVIAHRVTAGIGGIYPQHCGRVKSCLFFALWLFHILVHFTLDFYESVKVFDPSWATSIAIFFVTMLVCTYFTAKKSVPWFSKRIRKLNNEGLYPITVRKVEILMKILPPVLPVLSVSAAMGQFLCYFFDDALRLDFSDVSINGSSVAVVPGEVEIVVNILRGTSLIHVYFEFWCLLLFHLIVMLMLQSSMAEFNERMYFKLREHPVDLTFAEAVDIFSSRVKFVREGSEHCTGVVLTLCLACSISFIINAYNYLFIKPFAIYIWFAIAPLIWLVVPLMGAAWVTKTYQKFKMVVVNSWVEIPDEDELEKKQGGNEEKHGMARIGQKLKNTIRRKSQSPEPLSGKDLTPTPQEKNFSTRKRLSLQIPSSKTSVFRTTSLNSQASASTPESRTPLSSDSDDNGPRSLSATWSPTSSGAWRNVRSNSWTPVSEENTKEKTDTPRDTMNFGRGSSSTSAESVSGVQLKVPNPALATLRAHSDSCLQNSSSRGNLPPLKLKKTKTTPLGMALEELRKKSGDVFEISEGEDEVKKGNCNIKYIPNNASPLISANNAMKTSSSETKLEKSTEQYLKEVPQDLQCTLETLCESSDEGEEGVARTRVHPATQGSEEKHEFHSEMKSENIQEYDSQEVIDNQQTESRQKTTRPPTIPSVVIQMPTTDTNQNSQSPVPKVKAKNSVAKSKGWGLFRATKNPNLLSPIDESHGGSSSDGEQSDIEEPNAMDKLRSGSGTVNLMRGIARTVTKWRTKVKVKKNFNFEKYIMYLENILPDVGFVVGNVAISWDMVFLLCSVLCTLVGVFAQEAFFGN